MFSKTKAAYQKIFNHFNQKKVLIIGDVMLDSYIWGRVERISPEAPVPVVSIEKRESRLGGAANVALNVHQLGATPILVSVIGEDESGDIFLSLLKQSGLPVQGILRSADRPTTNKTRIIGNHAQLLRIDEEKEAEIKSSEGREIRKKILELITKGAVDVVIFEDYDKGLITEELIRTSCEAAKQHNIPVVADPKKKQFSFYRNLHLFKPNLKELKEGLKTDLSMADKKQLIQAIAKFQTDQHIDIMLVTLSEHGVLVSYVSEEGKLLQKIIPAHLRNISDVSGAGDTLIATAALCVASGLDPIETAAISNLAGGLVCEHVGVVPIDKKNLLSELLLHVNNR